MRVYRIYRKHRRDAAFTGEGARIAGARWNLPGTPIVYTCATISLCLLELFVHFDPAAADMTQLNLEYRWADIPETLPRLEVQEAELPRNWREIPWPQSTQELGTFSRSSDGEEPFVKPCSSSLFEDSCWPAIGDQH